MSAEPQSQRDNNRVVIFDTTLRDGEQCPGATMTFEEKLEVADLLDEMGVDIIEAGFPIASQGDFEAVAEIARRVEERRRRRPRPRHLRRHRPRRRGGEAREAPAHPHLRLHLADPPRAPDAQGRGRGGRDHPGDRRAGAQSRRQRRMVGDGRDPHPDRLSLPLRRSGDPRRRHDDQSARYGRLCHAGGIRRRCSAQVRERVPNSDKAVFSVHCHDDLGLAVANSLAGVEAGARQVECTINGLGERAGNAALEEVVMAHQDPRRRAALHDRHRRRRSSPAPRGWSRR